MLPVAAVSASVASIASATTASTVAAAPAAPTSPAAPASTTMTAAPASAATTFALRTRFVDDQRSAEKFLTVQCRDGLFGFRVILDFRKTKPAGLSGESIAEQSERIGLHASFRK